jgi:hypothetical protein
MKLLHIYTSLFFVTFILLQVSVSSLEPVNASINGSAYTKVVFCIWPYPKYTTISPTWISIIRSSFMSLVVRQSTLELTKPLFGNSSFFEVQRFPGGITIIPEQNAFLLQRPYAFFNFTLNFPIYKVQDEIEELKNQMKRGLYLNSYEVIFQLYLSFATFVLKISTCTNIVLSQPSMRTQNICQTPMPVLTNYSPGPIWLIMDCI